MALSGFDHCEFDDFGSGVDTGRNCLGPIASIGMGRKGRYPGKIPQDYDMFYAM